MRIQRPNGNTIDSTKVETKGAQKSQGGVKSENTAAAVVASSVGDVAALTAKGLAAREARIEALRSALQEGSYEVDYDKLAESILEDEQGRTG